MFKMFEIFKSKQASKEEAAKEAAKEAIKSFKAPEEAKDSQTEAIRNFLQIYKEARDIEKHFKM